MYSDDEHLNLTMSSTIVFSLFYAIFSFCIIYPPSEFTSAGLTIPNLFSNYLGSENEMFIQYHIKRIAVTFVVNAALPFGYIFGLWISDNFSVSTLLAEDISVLWLCFVIVSIGLPLFVAIMMFKCFKTNWEDHPVCVMLKPFCNPNDTWVSVASDINYEFRRIDKLSIETSSIMKVIATENWVLKVTPYTIYVAHQRDTALILTKSDTHTFSHVTGGDIQFINIEVKPCRPGATPFSIRLNALDFKELQDRINRPITILPNVTFHKTILERFVDAFKNEISNNPKYVCTQELDACMGCMVQQSNVKLIKLCNFGSVEDAPSLNNSCLSCHCRPLWCADCMALWFASRQDPQQQAVWLSQKCTCPVCRATFCILDVSIVELSIQDR